jgi:hypothetical protein
MTMRTPRNGNDISLALACTWRPRGERGRVRKLFPEMRKIYRDIVISMPIESDAEDREFLQSKEDVSVVVMPKRGWGRYLAIQEALETPASHIHYADFDALVHWIEVQPLEWRRAMEAVRKTDCLIIGRTEKAMQTRPQAIQQTERIINLMGSHLLNQPVDLGAGNRGFSRKAAQFLMTHSSPGRWGDAEWPIMLHRAGFGVEYLAMDGLTWETPDRYREKAADPERQLLTAKACDLNAECWAFRTRIAFEIIQQGLEALENSSIETVEH